MTPPPAARPDGEQARTRRQVVFSATIYPPCVLLKISISDLGPDGEQVFMRFDTDGDGTVDPGLMSDCHFRKAATEYDRKPGVKWLSCTGK
jgi:hypothetical protein